MLNEFLKKIPAEQHALVQVLDTVISKAVPTLTPSLKWGNLTYHGKKNVCPWSRTSSTSICRGGVVQA